MAYDAALIRQRAEEILSAAPRMRIADLARRLDIERHTLQRALRGGGQTYRELQQRMTLAAVHRLRAADSPRTAKSVAYELGFSSPVALAHFLRRHGGDAP